MTRPSSPSFSTAQLKKLGERLRRAAEPTPTDLHSLADFRAQHLPVLLKAFSELSTSTQAWECSRSGRLKNTATILEKLRRDKTSLAKMQDIAGLRLVLVGGRREQDQIVDAIRTSGVLSDMRVDDRRKRPSHGYRAVHVIGQASDCVVEIQVRTLLQHNWAQVFEYLADQWGREVRYGDPPAIGADIEISGAEIPRREVIEYMTDLSEHIHEAEESQAVIESAEAALGGSADDVYPSHIEQQRYELHRRSARDVQSFQDAVASLSALKQVLAGTRQQRAADERIERGSGKLAKGDVLELIVYNRAEGRVLNRRHGTSADLLLQWRELDMQNRKDPNIEIVLLASESGQSMELTHGRYFKAAPELAGTGRGKTGSTRRKKRR